MFLTISLENLVFDQNMTRFYIVMTSPSFQFSWDVQRSQAKLIYPVPGLSECGSELSECGFALYNAKVVAYPHIQEISVGIYFFQKAFWCKVCAFFHFKLCLYLYFGQILHLKIYRLNNKLLLNIIGPRNYKTTSKITKHNYAIQNKQLYLKTNDVCHQMNIQSLWTYNLTMHKKGAYTP